MNVVVPVAGRGSRIASLDADVPKPLVPVAGRPMVAWALDCLAGLAPRTIIFVALEEHQREHGIADRLIELAKLTAHRTQVILLPEVTEGQLTTVLAAREFFDTGEDLLVANCDTVVVSNLGTHIADRPRDCMGIISVARMPGDNWSFVRTGADGRVLEVAEKRRISNFASTGLYYFAEGSQFVAAASALVRRKEKTNGEYYVIPVYQDMIQGGGRVDVSLADEMWDLGTPESARAFERARMSTT